MKHFSIIALAALMLTACGPKTDHIRILATSDTHGMFYPYSYALLQENPTSMCNVASIVKERKDDCTLLVEAGDIIQDNSSELFLEDDVHPMIAAMNQIGYDVWITGNHEYNYGFKVLNKIIPQCKAKFLAGNVYSPEGKQLGNDYVIIKKKGVKIGFIGMVTPNIVNWDKLHLQGWTVTNPVEETAELVKELRPKVDLLIAVEHMGLENEYNTPGSGARELAMTCPELDLIVSAHFHQGFTDTIVNGVRIVQNQGQCRTMTQVDFKKTANGWETTGELINVADYAPDSACMAVLQPYHERALAEATKVIGRVEGGDLIPADRFPGVCNAYLGDHPWPDLVAEAMKHYADADIAVAFAVPTKATILDGQEVTKADGAVIYKFANTLYKLRMTGKQLKTYMEWTAGYYQTYKPGQPLRFNRDFASFNFDMFTGVDYEINVSKPAGQRIENLCWSETKVPVEDTDTFTIAISNYRAGTQMLNPGVVFPEGEDLPVILETDIRSDIGNVRAIICHYIEHELKGVITPRCNHNWRLTGLPADFTVEPDGWGH